MLIIAIVVGMTSAVPVESDYAAAYAQAQAESKWLVVDVGPTTDLSQIDDRNAGDCVFCSVAQDAQVTIGGKSVTLAQHPAFADLQGSGVAVIDLKNPAYHGSVVSALPRRHVSTAGVRNLLSLPAGTLTQRTLTWALRMHPEQPRSVWGTPAPELMNHAARHSKVQADTNNQHHNLPVGIASSEIVAESWPWNHHVVDAAIDIVHSWRQSPGHWGAARRQWTSFGYDMKTNGQKWFATGVFR